MPAIRLAAVSVVSVKAAIWTPPTSPADYRIPTPDSATDEQLAADNALKADLTVFYGSAHDGEEAGIVMSGQLEIWIDGKSCLLGQGDSFAFKSTLPHRYQNPGMTEAVVIWAITPPSY